jgi:membrane dipeptidase
MHSRRHVVGLAIAAVITPVGGALASGTAIRVNALGNLWDPNLSLGATAATRPGGRELEVDDRAIADAKRAGLGAINVTVGYVSGGDDPHEATLKSLDHWDGLIRLNPQDLLHVTRSGDMTQARSSGKVGIIYGFQNSVQIGTNLDHLPAYAARGVKVVQITYNDVNQFGGGSVGPEDQPLTPAGHRLVQALNDARVMVDLSHSCRQTCIDATAVSRQPVSINHTGCRALSDLPRNKTDAELRDVARRGGFVGIYSMPYLRPDGRAHASDAADHIAHALKVCGEDHVGIGTDGTATRIDDMAHFRAMNAKDYATRLAAGVATKGEAADVLPFVEELTGPGQYDLISVLLQRRRVPSRVIDKVLGSNFVDYSTRVW